MPTPNRVDDTVDEDGYIVPGYSWWNCTDCNGIVERYRGQYDADCPDCGACYNAGGQRLRDDWRGNMSNYDDEIGDMEGFERQHAGDW